jgi:hypothetical protein
VTSVWRERWLTIGLQVLVLGGLWILFYVLLVPHHRLWPTIVSGGMVGALMGVWTVIRRELDRRHRSRSN